MVLPSSSGDSQAEWDFCVPSTDHLEEEQKTESAVEIGDPSSLAGVHTSSLTNAVQILMPSTFGCGQTSNRWEHAKWQLETRLTYQTSMGTARETAQVYEHVLDIINSAHSATTGSHLPSRSPESVMWTAVFAVKHFIENVPVRTAMERARSTYHGTWNRESRLVRDSVHLQDVFLHRCGDFGHVDVNELIEQRRQHEAMLTDKMTELLHELYEAGTSFFYHQAERFRVYMTHLLALLQFFAASFAGHPVAEYFILRFVCKGVCLILPQSRTQREFTWANLRRDLVRGRPLADVLGLRFATLPAVLEKAPFVVGMATKYSPLSEERRYSGVIQGIADIHLLSTNFDDLDIHRPTSLHGEAHVRRGEDEENHVLVRKTFPYEPDNAEGWHQYSFQGPFVWFMRMRGSGSSRRRQFLKVAEYKIGDQVYFLKALMSRPEPRRSPCHDSAMLELIHCPSSAVIFCLSDLLSILNRMLSSSPDAACMRQLEETIHRCDSNIASFIACEQGTIYSQHTGPTGLDLEMLFRLNDVVRFGMPFLLRLPSACACTYNDLTPVVTMRLQQEFLGRVEQAMRIFIFWSEEQKTLSPPLLQQPPPPPPPAPALTPAPGDPIREDSVDLLGAEVPLAISGTSMDYTFNFGDA